MLQVGDIVLCTSHVGFLEKEKDIIGIVKDMDEYGDSSQIGVEFFQFIRGHDINGHGMDGFGWYCYGRDLIKIKHIDGFTLLSKGISLEV